MLKILILSSLLTLIIQINSIDVPDFKKVEDLIKFAGEVKEIFSGNVSFKESSIADETNPAKPVHDVVKTIIDELDEKREIPDDLRQYFISIDYMYQNFMDYASSFNNYNNESITEFVEMITSKEQGQLALMMEDMMQEVVSDSSSNIWQSMVTESKDECDKNVTLQDRIFESYKTIIVVEIMALVVAEGANSMKASMGNGDSTPDYDEPEKSFVSRVKTYFEELKKTLESVKSEIYRCDSETHVRGENYIDFEGLFYGFMMNVIEIGRRRNCGRQCEDIQEWGTKRCIEKEDGKICSDHPCQGLIHSCGWIGGDVDICENDRETLQRYQFLRSYSNGWYGKWSRCDGGRYYEIRSPYYFFDACATCLCTCSESWGSSKAIRTMSLRPQISNIEENKVVVDVKFVSEDQMIQVQIQQAPLQPNGEVDKSQAEWVPLENVTYDSKSEEGSFLLVEDGFSTLERNVDFAFITKDDNILNIDQISGGSGYVLTGVRFSRQLNSSESDSNKDQLPGPIELEIRVTSYDYSTGQLNTEEDQSKWIKASDQPNPPEAYNDERKDLEIGYYAYTFEPDISHVTDVQPNRFVRFGKSSIHSDIGQTVVPAFDSRPIESQNNKAPVGLGIIYRRANNYGGFLAFKLLVTSSLEGALNSEATEDEEVISE